MRPGTLARVLAIAVLIAGCDQTQPSHAPGSNVPASVAATAGPGATLDGAPSTPPSQPDQSTSASKIAVALASGAIDEPTSILYRLYASAGDDRLPSAYGGAWSEDDPAADVARVRWDSFPPDVQASMLPFLVRPTSPRSTWAASASASRRGPQLVSLTTASVRLAASACQDGFIRKQVSPTVPILVWGQCGGMSESAVAALVDEVRQDMADLWGPMTAYMGDPIGDANVAGDQFADSPEGGDGMLDIYLVDASLRLHGRTLSTGALASTVAWAPYVGPADAEATSTFIVVSPGAVAGVELRSTLAHEFFHSLQAAHNRRGMWYLAIRTGGGLPPRQAWQWFWFVEASAVWAQDEFVPEARAVKGYERFTDDFQASTLSMSEVNHSNEYASFVWPLFMQQELGRSAVADAWTKLEGKDGYAAATSVLDGMLPFTSRFRDFAVRDWNEALSPGNAIDPLFQVLDPNFPTTQPKGKRASLGNALSGDNDLSFGAELPSLWSKYWVIEPKANVKSMTFDFTLLFPADKVDVDLLINTNGNWVRRSGNLADHEKICDVSYAVVVISNHDPQPDALVDGVWDVQGDTDACNAKGSYSVVLTGPKTGAGTYSGTGDVYCAATTIDGRIYWSATAVFPTAPFGELSNFMLQQNPSNSDTVSATAGGMETGLWQASSNLAGQTAHVGGSGAPGTDAHVSGDGTFTDSEGKVFTIQIAADCSDTSY
jgi:hypothetical protein